MIESFADELVNDATSLGTATAELMARPSEAEWLAARRLGIGASEAAIALGVAPYGSPHELWLRKLGRWPDVEQSEAMELGLLLEDDVAELYRRRTGRRIEREQVFLRGRQRPHLLATLDAVDSEGEVVEFKTTSAWAREVGEEGTDELPAHWLVQAHQQMYLAQAERVRFAVRSRR